MTLKKMTLSVMISVCLTWGAGNVLAQGSLTPPGAPGVTMKTLEQVEPRIPIPGGTVSTTINSSGSYYLTGNLYRTLTISANNVTLNLMGYTIDPASGDAIDIPKTFINPKNLVIRNGILTGAATGLDARYLLSSNSRFENLTVSNCSYCGLYIGSDCVVENCLIKNCNSYGIQSSSVGRLDVRNCRIIDTTGDGVVAAGGSKIIGNTIENSSGDGLRLTGSGTYVAGNIIKGNVDNYDLSSSNQINILLCELPETLSWPCAVKLAGRLICPQAGVNGITVDADDITIDLAGHALIGPGASSGHGIYQADDLYNLTILNGKISGWSNISKGGIFARGSSFLIHGIQVTTNFYGMYLFDNGAINDCTAMNNVSIGIRSGSKNVISDCIAKGNGAYGISASSSSKISNCVSGSNRGGISTGTGTLVSGCVANYNTTDGIMVNLACRAIGNQANNNDDAGILVSGSHGHIEGNSVMGNDIGIEVNAAVNFIVRNIARANTVNYDISTGNKVGVIVSPPDSGAIMDGSGTALGVGTTDPWANFSY